MHFSVKGSNTVPSAHSLFITTVFCFPNLMVWKEEEKSNKISKGGVPGFLGGGGGGGGFTEKQAQEYALMSLPLQISQCGFFS